MLTDYNPKHRKVLWSTEFTMQLPCKASVYFCTDDYVIIKIASHRAGENVLLATLGSCFTAFYESEHFKKLQEEFA